MTKKKEEILKKLTENDDNVFIGIKFHDVLFCCNLRYYIYFINIVPQINIFIYLYL